ncbi:MAG TPA: aspartate aminotransferase family protein [Terriglobales bacterium]|nr:aspartate aminotransferase family protein [Terriglobales bacterium]
MKTLAETKQKESQLLLPTYDRYPLLLERGKGVYVFDAEGKKYLDFVSGIGVNALGYGDRAVLKTIVRQSARLIHTSNLFYHEFTAELAERLTRLSGLDRVFFTNSGTESWETALKLARAYAKKRAGQSEAKWRILAMQNSFHGRTFGSLATTGQKKYREPFEPVLPGVEFVTFNDVEDLKQKFNDSVCAVAIETVQGEGGVRPVTREFMETARALTAGAGALLLIDEIQCGLGRTGEWFAYQHYSIRPDAVTIAKPIAGGLSLGAVLATNEVASCFKPGMHGSTFGGGPLACAVGCAVIDQIEKRKLRKSNRELGRYFVKKLLALQRKHRAIRDVRGVGLMVAAELDSADLAKAAVTSMLEQKIIINRTHDKTLRFLPPYTIAKKHIDEVVKALDACLKSIHVAPTPAEVEKKTRVAEGRSAAVLALSHAFSQGSSR